MTNNGKNMHYCTRQLGNTITTKTKQNDEHERTGTKKQNGYRVG